MPTYTAACDETGNAVDTVHGGVQRTIVDPIHSNLIFKDFAEQLPPAYADADTAYNAWATALGLGLTSTLLAFTPTNIYQYVYFDAGFPTIDGGTDTHVFISQGGGLMLYKTALTQNNLDNDISVVNINVSSAPSDGYGGSVGYGYCPSVDTRAADFAITGADGGYVGNRQITDFKINKTSDTLIAIWTMEHTFSSANAVRVAFKLKTAFLEIVVSPISAANPLVMYALGVDANVDYEDASYLTAAPYDGTVSTFHFKSTDLGFLRPSVNEGVGTHENIDESAGTKWTTTPILIDRPGFSSTTNFGWPKTLSDGIGSNDVVAILKRFGPILLDTAGINDPASPRLSFRPTFTEGMGINDLAAMAIPKVLTDNMGISEAFAFSRRIAVLEAMGLADIMVPTTRFGFSVLDIIGMSEAAKLFLYALASDNIGINDTIARFFRAKPVVSETFQIADPVQPHFLLGIAAHDDFGIHDLTALHQTLTAGVLDGILITAGLVMPGDTTGTGTLTTWSINTKTGGATEYQNYDFNSFAQMGGSGGIGGRYLGASESGLYELDGADDAGTDIIATIKTGYAQMAGTHLAGLKGVYLGMRGTGDVLLKVETGDGKSYTYQAVLGSMRNTKVEIGKGIRARYMAFTLVTTGQDFDLDSVEFVPMVAKRRI